MKQSYLLFDPKSHRILGTVHAAGSRPESQLGHDHSAEMSTVMFDDDLCFDPVRKLVYAKKHGLFSKVFLKK